MRSRSLVITSGWCRARYATSSTERRARLGGRSSTSPSSRGVTVSSRTSTGPGAKAAGPGSGPVTTTGGWTAGTPAGGVGGVTSSASNCSVSADWRCGRSTRPTGCSVAAWRSTRTVRSLAATAAVVTMAAYRALSGASDCGSPTKRAASAPEERGRRAGWPGSSVTTTRSDQAHDSSAARAARTSEGADSPRTGRTSPGPSGTSQVPSSSSPIGTTTGACGNDGSSSSRAAWLTRHAAPPSTAMKGSGASWCGSAREKVTPDGDTQMVRTRGGAASARCWRTRPSRQLAASNASSAGTSPKRCNSASASTAGSDSGRRGRSRSPENGAGRRRRRERRAKAAQAREPTPSATSSGRRSGDPVGRLVVRPRVSGWWWASAGRRNRQPARSWSGSTKRSPPPMSWPRLSAATCIQSAPSPSRSSAICHRLSPGPTVCTASEVD